MTGAEFLTPPVLDFRWESAGAGEVPYPLRIRSHGATLDERAALRREVLATPVGGHVEDWLVLLGRAERCVDAVFRTDPASPPTSVLAAAAGGTAVLATQTDEGLWLRPIDPASLVSSVVGLLPPAPRGTEPSIAVAADDLAAGGRTPADRRALATFAEQRNHRAGQLGVTARRPLGGRSRPPVLSWFDTGTGRYLTYAKPGPDGQDWLTIAPADPPTLRHRLGELLAAVA